MKKLVVLLLVVVLGTLVYRRLLAPQGRQSPGAHRHGTPDHWPPVVRKPGTGTAPAA